MKRFWVVATVVFTLFMLPLLSQDEMEGLEEVEGLEKEGEKPSAPASGESAATGSEAGLQGEPGKGVTWKDTNGVLYGNSKVKFVLESKDSVSAVDFIEYRIDSGDFRKYQGPIELNEDGPHTITYRSVDKAGNREADKIFNVTIDNKAPEMVVLPARSFFVRDGKRYSSLGNSFSFRVTDEHSGVKTARYGINSENLADYNNEVIRLGNPGAQLIRFQATDNLGNVTSKDNLVIEVDGDKPTVEIKPSSQLVEVQGRQYAKKNTGFDVTGNDAGSGIGQILVRIDGGEEWQTYSKTLFFSKETDHTIEAKAVDAVGNESEVVKLSFVTDDNPPTTIIKTELE